MQIYRSIVGALLFTVTTCAYSSASSADVAVKFDSALSNPFNSAILAKSGAKYVYPQQACLDEPTNRLFVINATRGGGDRSQWASVYDFATGRFLSTFQVGDGLGETCVIERTGAVAALWVKSKGNNLLKFNVTATPSAMSKPGYEGKSKTSVYYQAAKSGDLWLSEQNTPHRDVFQILDWTFKKRGEVSLRDPDLGNEKRPKRQALATWGGRIVASYGSNFMPGRDPTLTKFGVRVFDHSGSMVSDQLSDPSTVMEALKAQGVSATRLENEGVFVTSSGVVYVLAITQAANSPGASVGGLTVLRVATLK